MKFITKHVFLILICIGLVAVVGGQFLRNIPILKEPIETLANTVLISGLLGMLYKEYIDGIHYAELRKILKIHESISDSGLLEFHKKSNGYNYAPLIKDSKKLTIVVNDGLNWINKYANELRERFSHPTETLFIHLDPDSRFVPALCQKVQSTEKALVSKLGTAQDELRKYYNESKKKGELKIYQLKTYPTKSIFLTESRLVITPYQAASTRVNIPVFVYEATDPSKGYCKDIIDDLSHMENVCELVYSSDQSVREKSDLETPITATCEEQQVKIIGKT